MFSSKLISILACVLVAYFQTCAGIVVPTCPSGWTSASERCYKAVRTQMTWNEAQQQCLRNGGFLAQVLSEADTMALQEFNPEFDSACEMFWVAGRRCRDGWAWPQIAFKKSVNPSACTLSLPGCSEPYSNWSPGEPNDEEGIENCIELQGQFEWNDKDCLAKRCFICQA